jgi:membrane fusion protein, copper/silver efflux system
MFVTAVVRLPMGKIGELDEASHPATQPSAAMLPHGLTTHDVARAYLDLAAVYAQDKTDPAALAKLLTETDKLVEHAPDLLPAAAVAAQAKALEGKTLSAQRETFKALSAALIELLRLSPPEGLSLYIAHCPMAKADWISPDQEHEKLRNPYEGSAMLTCADEKILPIAPAATGAAETDRFATGYYCPIYPDRLYDKPEHCPIDKFPLKYVRVEKVLAAPESAIIDSGTRKVAYRETIAGSGTFDMVEVKLGARAGEFYPVVSGLKAGDRVATQGAFLVDAENRLNPAAAAQYLGVSGGPTAAHKH